MFRKRQVLLLLTLWGFSSYSFTMIASQPARYTKDLVAIRIIDNPCDNIDMTAQDVEDLVRRSMGQYWNSVETSRLRFNTGPRVEIGGSATLNEMVSAISENEIVIGCSDDPTLFNATNILAKGTMTVTAPVRGVVAINNIVGSQFSQLSEMNRMATIAHELGHAIGIGHSSHEHALMYYAITTAIKQEFLAQDDADALTYLYPNDNDPVGLLGACSTIRDISDNDRIFNALISVLLVLAFYFSLPLFRIYQRRFSRV